MRLFCATPSLLTSSLPGLILAEIINASSFCANDCSKGFGSKSKVFLFEKVDTMSGFDREFVLEMLTMFVVTVEEGKDMTVRTHGAAKIRRAE